MGDFTQTRGIQLQTTPPLHLSFNPVETFMRPLGKAMKIAHKNSQSENETLLSVLTSYRQTPHPVTGISPAAMLFRVGMRSNILKREVAETEIAKAKQKDIWKKEENEALVNRSKYRMCSTFKVGDLVLIRNYNKSRKFESPLHYRTISDNRY